MHQGIEANLAALPGQQTHGTDDFDQQTESRETAAGIAINPAAFTHTSVAILDALNAFDGPVFEIHISNVHKREAFRHHSYVSSRADGVIAGFGIQGYTLALQRLAHLIDETAAKKDQGGSATDLGS